MSDFAALMEPAVILAAVGDDVIYHARGGDLAIRAVVDDGVDPVYSGEAYLTEGRLAIDVALADVPGLAKGSRFSYKAKKYTVEAIVEDDGVFARCLVV